MNEEDYFGVLSSSQPQLSQSQLPKANTNNVVMQEDNSVYLMQRVDLEYLKAMKSKLRCNKLANLKIDATLFPAIFAIFNKQIRTLPPRDGISIFCDAPLPPPLPPSLPLPLPANIPAKRPANIPAKRPRVPNPPLSESDEESDEESEDNEEENKWYVNVYRKICIRFPAPLDYSFITFNQNRMAFNTTTEIENIDLGNVHVDIEIVRLPSRTGCCAACLTKYRKMWSDKDNAMERTVLMCRKIERISATEFCFEMKFLCPPEHHRLKFYEVFFMLCHLGGRGATHATKMEHRTNIPVHPFRPRCSNSNAVEEIAVTPVSEFSLQ